MSSDLLLHETATQSQINNVVLKDFYNGIRFAQGNDGLHYDLYALLGLHYQVAWASNALDALPVAMEYVREASENFPTPPMHSDKGDVTTASFLGTFEAGMSIIRYIVGDPETALTVHDEYVDYRRQTMQTLFAVDAGWLDHGRPGRQLGQDPHSSQVREYILGGRRSRSSFAIIFEEVRADIASGIHTSQMEALQKIWDEKHPGGEPFYVPGCPPELMPAKKLGSLMLPGSTEGVL